MNGAALLRRPTTPAWLEEAVEEAVFDGVNEVRLAHGVARVGWDPTVAVVAWEHSAAMAVWGFFAHEVLDGRRHDRRLRDAGVRWRPSGENLFCCSGAVDPAGMAVDGWLHGPDHREVMLMPGFRGTGIGVVWLPETGAFFITQVFVA